MILSLPSANFKSREKYLSSYRGYPLPVEVIHHIEVRLPTIFSKTIMAACSAQKSRQVQENFQKQKDSSLSGIDNSRKGNIDAPISDLVTYINCSEDFFTTSSCSGRVSVISEVR